MNIFQSSVLLAITVAATLALIALPHGIVAPPNLLEVQDEKLFKQWTSGEEGRLALVYFYAGWSPTCKAFTQEYKKVAQFFGRKGYSESIYTLKLDGPNMHSLSRKQGVEQFPTVRLYTNGEYEKYTGEYEATELIAWVAERLHPKMEAAGKAIPAKPPKRRLA